MNNKTCNEEAHDFLCSHDCKFIFCRKCGKVNKLVSENIQEEKANHSSAVEPFEEKLTNDGENPRYLIQLLTGKTLIIENITPESSVLFLKREIEELERIPVSQQMLIFGGRQLEDTKTLAEYNISREANINLIVKYNAGKISSC
jgi:large subunit ribosomal protein L40e